MARAPALQTHPEVDFAGVWVRRPDAAKELADRHGVRAYHDAEALFSDVDAVAVALPPHIQADLAVRAARAGLHLLLDKPLATTVERARAVADAARESGVASVVFFTTRLQTEPETWIAEQAAAKGWFTAHAQWLGSVFSGDSPYGQSPWRREKGALWDVGPHALSVLLPVLGPVDHVSTAARGVGDTVHLVLTHRSGASSTLTLSLTAPPAAAGHGLELRGTEGVTRLPHTSEGPVPAFARAVDALRTAAEGRPTVPV